MNVWTPEWHGKSQKPVMVYIHGGGNLGGGSSEATFDGESLARHGVVLVSLNYRLGPFGFFSHPALTRESPHHASGNQGILDQIAALKWVHDNVASFGGDANNVTIFGESAGSLDVSVLMTSPLSQGLFRRVIAQSGSVVELGDPLTLPEAEKRGEMAAANWKIPAGASVTDLRAVSAADILRAEPDYFVGIFDSLSKPGITVDRYVLPQPPAEVFAKGNEHHVALLHGSNSRDRFPPVPSPKDLKKAIEEAYGPIAGRAQELYVGGVDPLYGTPANQWAGDTSFRCAAVEQLAWHAAAGNPAYQYEFARVSPGREAYGAIHAAELPYVFGNTRPTHSHSGSSRSSRKCRGHAGFRRDAAILDQLREDRRSKRRTIAGVAQVRYLVTGVHTIPGHGSGSERGLAASILRPVHGERRAADGEVIGILCEHSGGLQ